jgi:hypothetical protein
MIFIFSYLSFDCQQLALKKWQIGDNSEKAHQNQSNRPFYFLMTKLMHYGNIHYQFLKNANCFTRYLLLSVYSNNISLKSMIVFVSELTSKKILANQQVNHKPDVASYTDYQTHEKLP